MKSRLGQQSLTENERPYSYPIAFPAASLLLKARERTEMVEENAADRMDERAKIFIPCDEETPTRPSATSMLHRVRNTRRGVGESELKSRISFLLNLQRVPSLLLQLQGA
jgi:hypothetical protein